MARCRSNAAASGNPFLLNLTLLLAAVMAVSAKTHNITKILADHPSLSTFNHYLTVTHLASEINTRQTITVCAVSNDAMDTLLAKHPSIYTIKNVLALHILLDYFGAKKLHQITNGTALAATLYQATGSATGSSGFVNITNLKGGKVAFGAEDNSGKLDATFVKSVVEMPYYLSVIQISNIISSSDALSPTPAPAELNLTSRMSAHGCKAFADALTADTAADEIYLNNLQGGLTVFCPSDDAFKSFLPRYKNLTRDQKNSLLLFHGVPIYNSISMLKSNNGEMNTLATNGDEKFALEVQNDGQDVTIKTKRGRSKITETLLDEQPVAVYTIDKVLLPPEIIKKGEGMTPAPAPAPTKGKGKKKKGSTKAAPAPKTDDDEEEGDSPSDSPAYSPDDDVADEESDDNGVGVVRFASGAWLMTVAVAVGLIM